MMDNKNKQTAKFITTFNVEQAALLRHMGFKELPKTKNNYYIFINEPQKLMFEKLDDVVFTNTLFT